MMSVQVIGISLSGETKRNSDAVYQAKQKGSRDSPNNIENKCFFKRAV